MTALAAASAATIEGAMRLTAQGRLGGLRGAPRQQRALPAQEAEHQRGRGRQRSAQELRGRGVHARLVSRHAGQSRRHRVACRRSSSAARRSCSL